MSRPAGLGDRQMGSMVVLVTILLLVLVAVLGYVTRMASLSRVGLAGTPPASTVAPEATGGPTGSPAPTIGAPAGAGLLPTVSARAGSLTTYRDERDGFRLQVQSFWRKAAVSSDPRWPVEPDYDVVFEEPVTGARLAVSRWPEGAPVAASQWVRLLAPGMEPVDGRWPSVATVAGEAATLVWSDESATAPARYGAFFERNGRRYAVTYSAADGGGLAEEYVRALVTLEWTEADTPDLIPLPPRCGNRYYPSTALFGRAK